MSAAAPLAAPAAPSTLAKPARARLPELDWLRGFVMVLMTIDHAGVFDAGHLFTDGAFMYEPGTPLPVWHFLTRWITHLCAPTFVFLAGASLALSVEKSQSLGDSPWSIDRFLLTRGLFILALDPLWMSLAFMGPGNGFIFQVLYAIGGSFIAMALLRRLPTWAAAALGLFLMLGAELLAGIAVLLGAAATLPVGLLLTGGRFGSLVVAYPLLPWLGIMLVGFAFGRRLIGAGSLAPLRPRFFIAGAASLALFAALRGLNGFGNMRLYRDDLSLVQWLHVSKYPPAITYDALELGIMALLLAFLAAPRKEEPAVLGVLGTFGKTAFFFYLLHAHLLVLFAHLLGVEHQLGLGAVYGSALLLLVALHPLCVRYGRVKVAHPRSLLRYV